MELFTTMASNATSAPSGEREKLRSDRRLRLIRDDEAGLSYDLAPEGIYGFTYSPATDGVPIFNKHTYQCFEVHKLEGGSLHYIGYMTEEEADSLNAATEPVDLRLYPEPYEKVQRFVSVPKDRIIRMRPVSRESGNWFGFTILPG